jgi:hypothetical protein
MKNSVSVASLLILGVIGVRGATVLGGQNDTTQTTLTASLTNSGSNNLVCIASATGVLLPSISQNGSYFVADSEAMQVISSQGTLCYNVKRGVLGTRVQAHLNAATVWVAQPSTGTGDSSRPFSGGAIATNIPTASCTASAQFSLPIVVVGNPSGAGNGEIFTCTAAGYWGRIRAFYVPPTQCTTAPTTSTVTNTYTQIGASNVFVLNATTNSAAGTTTLTCDVLPPTDVLTSTGAILMDITLFIGSQTTAPTSLGTSTLGSITFPAAATSETPSTVTPVAVGGTVTTVSPTAITTVTTAGAFLTIKHTYANQVRLSNDLQVLQYTMPFLQSAAAVMTLNTPGLLVHYTVPTAVSGY